MAITNKRMSNEANKKMLVISSSTTKPAVVTINCIGAGAGAGGNNQSPPLLAPKLFDCSSSGISSNSSNGSMSPEPMNMCEQLLISDQLSTMSGDEMEDYEGGQLDGMHDMEKPKRKRQRLDHLTQEEKIMRR